MDGYDLCCSLGLNIKTQLLPCLGEEEPYTYERHVPQTSFAHRLGFMVKKAEEGQAETSKAVS